MEKGHVYRKLRQETNSIHLLPLFCPSVENGHVSEVSSTDIRLNPGGPELNNTGIHPWLDLPFLHVYLIQASTLKEKESPAYSFARCSKNKLRKQWSMRQISSWLWEGHHPHGRRERVCEQQVQPALKARPLSGLCDSPVTAPLENPKQNVSTKAHTKYKTQKHYVK